MLVCLLSGCGTKNQRASGTNAAQPVQGSVKQQRRKVPVVPRGVAFVCTPTAVWDGDGPVWCKEGPKVRLSGVAAREHDESCRPNQPCPTASGRDARDALVKLLGGATGTRPEGHIKVAGPPLQCNSEGPAKGDRTAAWCFLPNGRNLSCAMIQTGTALRWAKYDPQSLCNDKAPATYTGEL